MALSFQSKPTTSIPIIVDRILSCGHLNRQEHLQLITVFLSDPTITDDERRQINQVFDYIQIGRLKLVDEAS